MRRAVSEWWHYGQPTTRWGRRDYLRHFGFVLGGFAILTCHFLAIMSHA